MAQALKGSSGRLTAGTATRTTVLTRGSQIPPGVIISGGGKSAVASVAHSNQQSAATTPVNNTGTVVASSSVAANITPPSGVMLAPHSANNLMSQTGISPAVNGTARNTTHSPSASASVDHEQNLANTKEKTPMCLINELARFNKVQHQYMLTDEQGPAHKKTFFVKLKLGEEEYAASGPSIKKAQHAAAAIALEKTAFKHPPPKPNHNSAQASCDGNPSITPTVELNALAMKRGEPAIYRTIEPARPQYYNNQPNFDFRGMYNQRYHYPKMPRVFYMSLKVGQREFIGEGATRQAARHNAAEKALKVLRCLSLPHTGAPRSISILEEKKEDEDEDEEDEDENDGDEEENGTDDLKSEISLVHEIALKRGLSVNFEITKESGPPHMRTFVTRCTCGSHLTEGTGNSKKVSKKRAAELMLEELKKLPQLPQQVPKVKKLPGNKKKNRNLIKKANMDYGIGINPISRLIQIQQAKKEREPVYTLVAERGLPRRREFVMQVTVGEEICTGVGPNKKLAKRNAAEQMLQQLGYSRPSPQPNKSSIKSPAGEGSSNSDKKVKFLDQEPGTARQLVPGVLLLPDGARGQGSSAPGCYSSLVNQSASYSQQSPEAEHTRQKTATIAKELLDTGASPTAEALAQSETKPSNSNQPSVRPVQQLLYLAHVLGFKVEFSDFPKGTDKEHLSLVMLSTSPPHVSHGSGPTVDASHDVAALTALQELAKMGLDKVTVASPAASAAAAAEVASESHSMGPSGDGPANGQKWVKSEMEVKVKTEAQ